MRAGFGRARAALVARGGRRRRRLRLRRPRGGGGPRTGGPRTRALRRALRRPGRGWPPGGTALAGCRCVGRAGLDGRHLHGLRLDRAGPAGWSLGGQGTGLGRSGPLLRSRWLWRAGWLGSAGWGRSSRWLRDLRRSGLGFVELLLQPVESLRNVLDPVAVTALRLSRGLAVRGHDGTSLCALAAPVGRRLAGGGQTCSAPSYRDLHHLPNPPGSVGRSQGSTEGAPMAPGRIVGPHAFSPRRPRRSPRYADPAVYGWIPHPGRVRSVISAFRLALDCELP
jgi:hypothetical protein